MVKDERMTDEGDPLVAATHGQYRWHDPGMDAIERGWEEFALGQQVEVKRG